MSYFIPSFIQKRLLRYSLSHLGILNTEALSLDDLEISWGKSSQVELKNVRIRHQKVAALLGIPEICKLSGAIIGRLCLTVPADLYSSGIVIEIEGLRLRADVSLVDQQESQSPGSGRDGNSRASHNDSREDPQVPKRDRAAGPTRADQPISPSASIQESELVSVDMPDAHQLASSFLRSESNQEKRALRDAMLKSQVLDKPLLDDAAAGSSHDIGVGSDISLPAFLASFLNGVVERARVSIRDVIVDIALQLKVHEECSERQHSSKESEAYSFRLVINDMQIGHTRKRGSEQLQGGSTVAKSLPMEGDRCVSINDLGLSVLYCPATISRIVGNVHNFPSSKTDQAGESHPDRDSRDTPTQSVPPSSDQHTAEDVDNKVDHSAECVSIHSQRWAPLAESSDNQGEGYIEGSPEIPGSASGDELSEAMHDLYLHNDTHDHPSTSTLSLTPSPQTEAQFHSPHSTSSQDDRDFTSDDLTQSRLYSHEEAVSMYVSALEEGRPTRSDLKSFMPGAWDSTDIEGNPIKMRSSLECVSSADDIATNLPPSPCVSERSISTPSTPISGGDVAGVPSPVLQAPSPSHSTISANAVRQMPSTSTTMHGVSQGSFHSYHASHDIDHVAKTILKITDIKLSQPLNLAQTASGTTQDHTAKEDAPASKKVAFSAKLMRFSGDMLITKLLLATLQQAKTAFPADSSVSSSKANLAGYEVEIDIEHIIWSIHESIKADASAHQKVDEYAKPESLDPDRSCALLSVNLDRSKATYAQSDTSSSFDVNVANIKLSDAVGIVLEVGEETRAVDRSQKARDANTPNTSLDLQVGVSREGLTTMNMRLLPLRFTLDIQRFDETLNSFGGLSSVLEVGNSMLSTITLPEAGNKSETNMRRRMVHFAPVEAQPSSLKSQQSATFKMNIKIDGLQILIRGTDSALYTETTALKMVKRGAVIAVQLDKAKIKGPAPIGFADEAIPSIDLHTIRVEYHTLPRPEHLTQLIELVAPSKLQKEDRFDDNLIIDTLMQQRKKGGFAGVKVDHVFINVVNIDSLEHVAHFVSDLRRLSRVARYLPEDDRPGMLISSAINTIEVKGQISDKFGSLALRVCGLSNAVVTCPLLMAIAVDSIALFRNDNEEIIETSFPQLKESKRAIPIVLARYIGNEMEPVVRVRLHNLRFEYKASLLAALSDVDIAESSSSTRFPSSVASSIATLMRRATGASNTASPPLASPLPSNLMRFPSADILIKDTFIGLESSGDGSKAYIKVDRALVGASLDDKTKNITVSLEKASFLITSAAHQKAVSAAKDGEDLLRQLGYAFIGNLFLPDIKIEVSSEQKQLPAHFAAQVEGGLLLLETCADSTQTLLQLLPQLTPPKAVSTDPKYRTETVAITDMLASIMGQNALPSENAGGELSSAKSDKRPYFTRRQHTVGAETPDLREEDDRAAVPNLEQSVTSEKLTDEGFLELDNLQKTDLTRIDAREPAIGQSYMRLDFDDDHFRMPVSSQDDRYEALGSIDFPLLKIKVRNFHTIWNLFDGYDWHDTREKISQAVADVRNRACKRTVERRNTNTSTDTPEAANDVIGDFLFNSIYIGIPAQSDPADLTAHINENIQDHISSGDSQIIPKIAGDPQRPNTNQDIHKAAIQLKRSKHHKMTFELKRASCELTSYGPGNETVASFKLGIQDLEVFDHLPSSTWKKFATYMSDAGERESDSSMVAIDLHIVRPVSGLAATEFNLKVSVLPLRLHVDQDALDFLSRFFEFKYDQAAETSDANDAPFIQRAEVNPVRIKLDFKPKRVDYAGLRSGRTSEFMNFFVLDRAEMVLRHVILYGIPGFDRLGQTLNDIWAPDVKLNQLPGVLAGVGPVRSILGLGEGVRDLFVVPIREYQKDGRVLRSLQKGAFTFAKTTTGELARLGARLAVGTQTALQGAEDLLSDPSSHRPREISEGWDQAELEQSERERISLYSDQPLGILQGIRGGFADLERDLLTTKDAIIAMPGEIMESKDTGDAAKTVLRRAPTIVLRPAVGLSKAVGQTLLGATNSLDPANRKRMEDKYKRH